MHLNESSVYWVLEGKKRQFKCSSKACSVITEWRKLIGVKVAGFNRDGEIPGSLLCLFPSNCLAVLFDLDVGMQGRSAAVA